MPVPPEFPDINQFHPDDPEAKARLIHDICETCAWGMPLAPIERLILLRVLHDTDPRSGLCAMPHATLKLADIAKLCQCDLLTASRAITALTGRGILKPSELPKYLTDLDAVPDLWLSVDFEGLRKASWLATHGGKDTP